jgi:hypothetical protein
VVDGGEVIERLERIRNYIGFITFAAIVFFCAFLAGRLPYGVHAQTPAKPEPSVTAAAPQINAELRAKFWRVNAEALAGQVRYQQAQEALKTAQEAVMAMQAEMRAVCGADAISSPTGEPICMPAKPKESK